MSLYSQVPPIIKDCKGCIHQRAGILGAILGFCLLQLIMQSHFSSFIKHIFRATFKSIEKVPQTFHILYVHHPASANVTILHNYSGIIWTRKVALVKDFSHLSNPQRTGVITSMHYSSFLLKFLLLFQVLAHNFPSCMGYGIILHPDTSHPFVNTCIIAFTQIIREQYICFPNL